MPTATPCGIGQAGIKARRIANDHTEIEITARHIRRSSGDRGINNRE
jgi:hypothetical protein